MAAPIIRPATPSDLPQIAAINTYYIQNTVLTFMQNPPLPSTYSTKYHDIIARGLPYLVAVDPTTKHPKHNTDLVLGYTYLSPFRVSMLSYAATVELSLFIHPDHQAGGLGSRLLSAVLDKARTAVHASFEITPTVGAGGEEVEGKVGAAEPVKNILAVMAVNPEGLDGGEKLRQWYQKRGFVERGRMQKVGFKKGYWLDTVYLQYTLE